MLLIKSVANLSSVTTVKLKDILFYFSLAKHRQVDTGGTERPVTY